MAKINSEIDWDSPANSRCARNALAAYAQEGISAFLGKRPACWTGK
jgi:hypothetical protein